MVKVACLLEEKKKFNGEKLVSFQNPGCVNKGNNNKIFY